MGRSKHIGIMGVAVTGLLALGACGSKPTTLTQANTPEHEYVQHINAERAGFTVECTRLPYSRC